MLGTIHDFQYDLLEQMVFLSPMQVILQMLIQLKDGPINPGPQVAVKTSISFIFFSDSLKACL